MTLKEKQQYLILLGVAILISGVIGGIAGFTTAQSTLNNKPLIQTATKIEASDIVKVVEGASPAVVSIIVTKDLPKIDQNDLFRRFFGQDFNTQPQETEKREIGGGSGFIVSSDGFVVTNKHVVTDETADYTVLLNNGDKHAAKVLARDPLNDLAILKIEVNDLPTLAFGDSDALKPGQSVIAIGNALGEFRNTVSTGVISGLARSITATSGLFQSERLVGLIQTDASINPGNSGGPLLDTAGQVIGINVAIAQGAQNIGFAIPINQVKETIESVRQNGKLIRAWLGVRYVPITAELAQENNLGKDYGVLVVKGENPEDLATVPGSPADKAGLEENDIIFEADGEKITQDNPLAMIIARRKPGDILRLRVLHEGREKDTVVVLEEAK